MYTLELINPIAGKGLGREPYYANTEIVDEQNYIEIGVIVSDENGPTKSASVKITATHENEVQKTVYHEGTGTIHTVRVGDSKQFIPYYHFHYQFTQPGEHKIKFTAGEATEEVVINVPDWDHRPETEN